jgi:hypothetical protein
MDLTLLTLMMIRFQGQPLHLSPLGLPWSSREPSESELLTACIAEVNPASHALYAMEHRI